MEMKGDDGGGERHEMTWYVGPEVVVGKGEVRGRLLTAPTRKIAVNVNMVYLRPILAKTRIIPIQLKLHTGEYQADSPETGALPSAPKNAPAWRTETMFDETAFVLWTSLVPSGLSMPKWPWK
jgi:hypothetical protein